VSNQPVEWLRSHLRWTVLGQATWSVINGHPGIDYVPTIDALLDAGAAVDAANYPTGNDRIDYLLRRDGANS
jgi:hypothetical protein